MSARIAGIVLWLLAMVVASAQAQTVEYVHTDALGSVVAVTNASRIVLERREYEPYGSQTTPAVSNGPGYTGHVQDAATGLVYMQQRYYDPQLGVFLSIDPVTANSGTGANFHRYRYANNNPYSVTDPDGRCGTHIEGRNPPDCRTIQVNPPQSSDASADSSATGQQTSSTAGGKQLADTLSEAWDDFKSNLECTWTCQWPGDGSLESSLAPLAFIPAVGIEGTAARLTAAATGASKGGNFIRGMTVLGRYPGYIESAQAAGASYFNLGRLGNLLPKSLVWELNKRFLDRAVARGDHIVLAKPFNSINDAGSWLAREIGYLSERHGYILSDGISMVPP